MTTVWTAQHANPFAAIREAANAADRPQDIDIAYAVLAGSTMWQNWDPDNYLDDLLQEIAGATNIVCQYLPDDDTGLQFRAAYDN